MNRHYLDPTGTHRGVGWRVDGRAVNNVTGDVVLRVAVGKAPTVQKVITGALSAPVPSVIKYEQLEYYVRPCGPFLTAVGK